MTSAKAIKQKRISARGTVFEVCADRLRRAGRRILEQRADHEALNLNTGFRAFSSFGIADLTRVNLLVGRNNAGKTCLLDAVEIAVLGARLDSLLGSGSRRG